MDIRAVRIKELIKKSGKTYQELEAITGIKKSSLQRYASGATAKIPLEAMEKMAVAFGVSQAYLMGWEGKMPADLQGLGALAADVLMDPVAVEMMQKYMAMDEQNRQSVMDFMDLSDADRYAVRLVITSLMSKTKKD